MAAEVTCCRREERGSASLVNTGICRVRGQGLKARRQLDNQMSKVCVPGGQVPPQDTSRDTRRFRCGPDSLEHVIVLRAALPAKRRASPSSPVVVSTRRSARPPRAAGGALPVVVRVLPPDHGGEAHGSPHDHDPRDAQGPGACLLWTGDPAEQRGTDHGNHVPKPSRTWPRPRRDSPRPTLAASP
jgi:hypothetical protein